MAAQREMRTQWRHAYRFVPDADYNAMVLNPAKRSDTMSHIAALA
jgi:hypothetical protein